MNEEIILRILKESNKSLDTLEIAELLKDNPKSEDITKVYNILEDLIEKGLVIQTNNLKYISFDKGSYKKGKIEITSTGNGFLLLDDEDDIFIHKNQIRRYNVFDGDTLIIDVQKRKNGKKEGRILKILKRNLGNNIGEVYFENGKVKVKSLSQTINKNIIVEKNDLNVVEGHIVKLKVLDIEKNNMYVEIERIIAHKNAPDADTLIVLEELEIPCFFSEDTLKEASEVPLELTNDLIKKELNNGRIDLREELIFTIDGEDTKDIDDAISLKVLNNGYELGVHIADVSYYVKEGSSLKKEALERGNSVYMADKVVPMLPVELSNGICSLNPNVDRLAISCIMNVNNKGDITSYKIFKSIIKSKKKMTYESVNNLFDGKIEEDYKEFEEVLKNMLTLSETFNKAKKERGEIEFYSPEIKLIIDENNKVKEIKKRIEGKGQKLIENFMIAANTSIATEMYNLNNPFVYRIHGEPAPEKIKEALNFITILGHKITNKIKPDNLVSKDLQILLDSLKEEKDYGIINKKLLRCQEKAKYSPECLGHFALALKYYCHFTSPIRRYSDLMVHFFLNECLFNKATQEFKNKWDNSLNYICEHISQTEINAEEAEHEVNKLKIAEYLETRIGEEYYGIIDTTLSKGFFVETDNLINGFVPIASLDGKYIYKEDLLGYVKNNRMVYKIGDRVKVKVTRASKIDRQVDFMVIEKVD